VGQCRVRHHDTVARIEVDKNGAQQIMESSVKQAVVSRFKKLGFLHISLDLEGYKSGRMNRSLETKET